MGKNRLFVFIGCIFAAIGLILGGLDIYHLAKYDRVEADLRIVYVPNGNNNNNKKAHVDYEYDGMTYTDVGLSQYNAFTMKDGEKFTILINPEDPSHPQSTLPALDIIFVVFGGIAIVLGSKRREYDR